MSTLVPIKSNIITVLCIHASIFNWAYLRRYWWYVANLVRVIHHICCHIQSTISCLRSVKSGSRQMQYNYSSSYAGFNIQLNVSPQRYCYNSMGVKLHSCCQMQPKSSRSRYVNTGRSQIKYIYSSCHSGYNYQLNVSPLRLVVCRQIDAFYTPHLLPNAAWIVQITLCQHWTQSNSIYLQFLPFMLQYTIESISAAIGGLSIGRCASCYTFAAK
jgi:hypothetical protein